MQYISITEHYYSTADTNCWTLRRKTKGRGHDPVVGYYTDWGCMLKAVVRDSLRINKGISTCEDYYREYERLNEEFEGLIERLGEGETKTE